MRLWERLLRKQEEKTPPRQEREERPPEPARPPQRQTPLAPAQPSSAPVEPWLQAVPPQLSQEFLAADALGRQARFGEALSIYQRVHKSLTANQPAGTNEFLAILEIRLASVLVGMRRYKEAQRHLDAQVVRAYVKGTHFAPEHLYDYHSTLAQARGAVGDEEGMLVACTNALHVAWGVLRDPGRSVDIWRIMFEVFMSGGGWGQILERTAHAQSFAQGLPRQPRQRLLLLVERWQAFAYQQLGQREEARRHAGNLLADAQRRNDHEAVATWEAFLAGLG